MDINHDTLKISRILHAGYVFECKGTQVAFDPIFENPFSRNCHAFPDVQFDVSVIKSLKFDAVFISHFHDDHCSLESLNLLDRKTPIFLYCQFEELFALIKKLGFKNVHPLELDTAVQIGAIEVIPRRALDSDVDSMFHVKAAGLQVLNVVDSWIDEATLEQLAKISPWDMVLWPFQAMRETDVIAPTRSTPAPTELPLEWIDQLRALKPRYVVPSSCQFLQESWSWYNHAMFPFTYRQFQREVQAALPQTKVVRFNPSVSFELSKEALIPSAPLPWVHPIGEQNLDFDFKKDIQPPSTSEIAKHFSELTSEQSDLVYEYCETGLVKKFNSMDPPLDPYFEKPRLWRLSIFDHRGVEKIFYYRVKSDRIELTQENAGPLAWATEISLAKMYAALELGESLTSLYMRINAVVFDSAIEDEVQYVDIVEDPLVRCLYNGAFAAYQIAQLKRIRAAL